MRRVFAIMLSLALAGVGNSMVAPAAAASAVDWAKFDARLHALEARGLAPSVVRQTLSREFRVRFLTAASVPFAGQDRGDVDIDKPQLIIPEAGGGEQTMLARIRWRHDCEARGMRDVPCWQKDMGKHGGEEGIAVATSRPINFVDSTLLLHSNCARDPEKAPKASEVADTSGGASYGLGYAGRDVSYQAEPAGPGVRRCKTGNNARIQKNAYNWDQASLYVTFTWERPCDVAKTNFRAGFSHTWESTRVTGISVGLDSIGFSWDKDEHRYAIGSSVSAPCYG